MNKIICLDTSNYTHTDFWIPKAIFENKNLSLQAKILYGALRYLCNKKVTITDIAKLLNWTNRTVYTYLDELHRNNLIDWQRDFGDYNVYYILPLEQTDNNINEIEKSLQELINYYKEVFKSYNNYEPIVDKKDIEALRQLSLNYSYDDLKKFIKCFCSLDDDFLRTNGYQLKWLHTKISKIIQKLKKADEIENILQHCTDWQILEYMNLIAQKIVDETDPMYPYYIKEIKRRNLTEKDLKKYLEKYYESRRDNQKL